MVSDAPTSAHGDATASTLGGSASMTREAGYGNAAGTTAPEVRFARFAWGLLGYEVLVVAWGAYVRATGSGAGCGRHWPTCNGEILPRAARVETLIEFSHRLSSAGALIGALVLLVWAMRVYPRGHRVRRGAGVTTALVAAEALIGAGLVLFELVAHDASMKRAHDREPPPHQHVLPPGVDGDHGVVGVGRSGDAAPGPARAASAVLIVFGVLLPAMLVVGASGAVAALGRHAVPRPDARRGDRPGLRAGSHLFLRLRVIHPMLAMTTAGAIVLSMGLVRSLRPGRAVRLLSRVAASLAVAQVAAGIAATCSRGRRLRCSSCTSCSRTSCGSASS